MKNINNLTDSDKKFLQKMHSKLTSMHQITDKFGTRDAETYKDPDYNGEKVLLEEAELKKVLDIVRKNDNIFMRPIDGPFGFYPAFTVAEVNAPFPGINEVDYILRFSSKQLPEGYSYGRLKRTFASESNLKIANAAAVSFDLKESRYDY